MREQVMVLRPSEDKRTTGFSLGNTDEAMLATNRKYAVPEVMYAKRSLHGANAWTTDTRLEENHSVPKRDYAQRMERQTFRGDDYSTVRSVELEQGIDRHVVSYKHIKSYSSLHQMQEEPSRRSFCLQWGSLKKSRRRRKPNTKPRPYNSSRELTTQKSLFVKESSIDLKSSALGESTNDKKAKARRRDCPYSTPLTASEHKDLEADCRKEKSLRLDDAKDEKMLVSVQVGQSGSLLASSHTHQPEYLPITRGSTGKKVGSSDESPLATVYKPKASQTGKDPPFPKFVPFLSRKEIEEDFLRLKGIKLPKRPQRRPRAVETAVLMCTPGLFLSELSPARYNVRLRKINKEKPRGLKAMQGLE